MRILQFHLCALARSPAHHFLSIFVIFGVPLEPSREPCWTSQGLCPVLIRSLGCLWQALWSLWALLVMYLFTVFLHLFATLFGYVLEHCTCSGPQEAPRGALRQVLKFSKIESWEHASTFRVPRKPQRAYGYLL